MRGDESARRFSTVQSVACWRSAIKEHHSVRASVLVSPPPLRAPGSHRQEGMHHGSTFAQLASMAAVRAIQIILSVAV
eukprot:952294-Pleurochrysis_carterae.AAC.2